MKQKYKIEIKTNSEEVMKAVFFDLAKVYDEHGASLKPLNKETGKFLKENSE